MRQYPLLLDNVEVGSVSVVQEGLYCRIGCVCDRKKISNCCVIVKTENEYINLGKCTKESDSYVLRRFMPAKMLGKGELVFTVSNGSEKQKNLLELDPFKPFPEIALLPRGRFSIEQSECGIVIEDKSQDLG